MCGISGAVARRDDPAGPEFVGRALALQHQRGPDHRAGTAVDLGDWTISLGHNRLCIIDLAPTGHQPMWGAGRRAVVTYNGEIYNYLELREELAASGASFRGQSDTEVLLAAWARWGRDTLARLNGMFALALVDCDRGELVLARDRFGVKPLYYTSRPGGVRFASTLGPLLAEAGKPDLAYLRQGLALGAFEDDSSRTPHEGILSVPPGHLVRIGLEPTRLRAEVTPWYDLADAVAAQVDSLARAPVAAAAGQVRDLLTDAVALRLRSDVPVGVSLSGGVDSAAVARLAATAAGGVRGLTFGHPAAGGTEGPQVARLAAGSAVQADFVWPAPERMAELFWSCLRAQQAPFATASVVAQYAVFERARALGLTVMLGGQGGDEAFMGYRKYHLFRVQEALASRDARAVLVAAAGLGRVLWGERRQAGLYWSRGRQYATGVTPGSALRLGETPLPDLGLPAAGGSRARQLLDITRFSLPTLLRYEDRNSMGHSIESRLPFMDYRVVELGAALPAALKLRGGYGKWILREALAGVVPDELAWARAKRGFDVDSRGWIEAGLGPAIRDALDQVIPRLGGLVMPGLRVTDYFANTRLAGDRAVFADAVALLWLGGWAAPREGGA